MASVWLSHMMCMVRLDRSRFPPQNERPFRPTYGAMTSASTDGQPGQEHAYDAHDTR